MMVYRGHIKNGVVVLDEPVTLNEGLEVHVEVPEQQSDEKSLGEELLQFAGIIKGLPSDMSRNHDYYAHGRPRE